MCDESLKAAEPDGDVSHRRLTPPWWNHRSCNSPTCHPDISLWVKESQKSHSVLYRMTLARFVQISKCCDWDACNHLWAERQIYYPYERQALRSIVSDRKRSRLRCDHAEYQFHWRLWFFVCVFIFAGWKQGAATHLYVEWKRKAPSGDGKHTVTVDRGILAQRLFWKWNPTLKHESAASRNDLRTSFQHSSNSLPLPCSLIPNVQLWHKASVAAPAPAVNTNSVCRRAGWNEYV